MLYRHAPSAPVFCVWLLGRQFTISNYSHFNAQYALIKDLNIEEWMSLLSLEAFNPSSHMFNNITERQLAYLLRIAAA